MALASNTIPNPLKGHPQLLYFLLQVEYGIRKSLVILSQHTGLDEELEVEIPQKVLREYSRETASDDCKPYTWNPFSLRAPYVWPFLEILGRKPTCYPLFVFPLCLIQKDLPDLWFGSKCFARYSCFRQW